MIDWIEALSCLAICRLRLSSGSECAVHDVNNEIKLKLAMKLVMVWKYILGGTKQLS